jgi:cation transport protein ChaC
LNGNSTSAALGHFKLQTGYEFFKAQFQKSTCLPSKLNAFISKIPLIPSFSATDHRSDQAFCEPTHEALLKHWPRSQDLWIFGYASLIWRPEFDILEQHLTKVQGWHRALKMWSRLNRGTPECPGLVFALLSGGSCQGMVFRTPAQKVTQTIDQLWFREMPNNVYTTRWLQCPTPQGPVNALAFTLPRSSPSYTGTLSPEQYQDIFRNATGRYGTTLDYAQETLNSLKQHGIHDKALEALLQFAKDRP